MEKTRVIRVRNTQAAVRGLFDAGHALVNIEPGQEREVTLDQASFENADETGYFTFDADELPAGNDDPEHDDDLDVTTSELEAIAAREGVVLPTTGTGANGRVLKGDLQNAIRAARAAPVDVPNDELDAMSDADLLDAVTVLTGTRPADGTDRATLLQMARGEPTT